MLATLSTADASPGFSATNLVILIVVAAVLYPVQKKLRETVSRRRRERWAEEDRAARTEGEEHDRPQPTDEPG